MYSKMHCAQNTSHILCTFFQFLKFYLANSRLQRRNATVLIIIIVIIIITVIIILSIRHNCFGIMEWKAKAKACKTENWKTKAWKVEREKREMRGKREKDMSNERGSFSLMGLWERQIKTKDPPQPQEWKKWKKEEKKKRKSVRRRKKCHAKWYIYL